MVTVRAAPGLIKADLGIGAGGSALIKADLGIGAGGSALIKAELAIGAGGSGLIKAELAIGAGGSALMIGCCVVTAHLNVALSATFFCCLAPRGQNVVKSTTF
ncbi:MAG: hypothetical protein E6Y08_08075 [Paenibacillus sp.]|uniref:hypothetical protein n=1 Tax=Paenibacillus sp. TaxID=58172 RepID=UPI00290B42C8|nr:hypothetical protein [Paenibacillus sp.]MDU4695759.1 hypothetical protein [Paenibacillus sp.]